MEAIIELPTWAKVLISCAMTLVVVLFIIGMDFVMRSDCDKTGHDFGPTTRGTRELDGAEVDISTCRRCKARRETLTSHTPA